MDLKILKEHLLGMCGYNKAGEEIPDPRPMALPVGFTRPKPLTDTIRDLIRNEEFRRALDRHEMETFEEADDFTEDDEDLVTKGTPYEQDFDPEGVITREQEIKNGFVEEIPAEKRERSRELVHKIKELEKSKRKPKKEVKSEEKEIEED